MKAVILTKYGSPDVLKIAEVPDLSPKANEVLVQNYAASIGFGDLFTRKLSSIRAKDFHMPLPFYFLTKLLFGFKKPRIKILGSNFSGTVKAVGNKVTKFLPGDRVYGYRSSSFGTYAEYVTMPENGLISHLPSTVSFEDASDVMYGAITALSLLKGVNIDKKMNVLIIGASGSIGSYALQFARNYGATVTGVCGTNRIEFVKSLGADHVIDYNKEKYYDNGKQYDLIFDVLGKSSFDECYDSLTEEGTYLRASFKFKEILQMIRTSSKGKKVKCLLLSIPALN